MNLPQTITFTDNRKIEFVYDGTGMKLRKTTWQNGVILETRDYMDGFEYKDDLLDRIAHTEGYITRREKRANEGSEFVGLGGLVFQYNYVLKDHLGNTRVTFADVSGDGNIDPNTEISQVNMYYPFGLNAEGNWNGQQGANKYQYNDKEWNDDFGLGWNDYGARFYDPAMARWVAVDPMADKMRRHSPYNYAFDNPVIFVDHQGLYPILTITSTQTGVTLMRVPGAAADYPGNIVKTYSAILSDVRADGTTVELGRYNVTRAGYISLGKDKNGKEVFENRGFTPASTETRFRAELFTYVGSPALVLLQYRQVTTGTGKNKKTEWAWSKSLDATPLNTHFFLDGSKLTDHMDRANPAIATGVMVHIGSYFKDGVGLLRLAGAYGCMGLVNPNNVKQTIEEVKAADNPEKPETAGSLQVNISNETMNELRDLIRGAMETSGENKGRIDVIFAKPEEKKKE